MARRSPSQHAISPGSLANHKKGRLAPRHHRTQSFSPAAALLHMADCLEAGQPVGEQVVDVDRQVGQRRRNLFIFKFATGAQGFAGRPSLLAFENWLRRLGRQMAAQQSLGVAPSRPTPTVAAAALDGCAGCCVGVACSASFSAIFTRAATSASFSVASSSSEQHCCSIAESSSSSASIGSTFHIIFRLYSGCMTAFCREASSSASTKRSRGISFF